MAKYTKETLETALSKMRSGEISQREASRRYNIPISTLRHRRKGGGDCRTSHEAMQRLSVSQENRLADWIKAQDALGLAPTYAQVRALAARLLREQGDHTPLGKDWHIRFLQRQRSIKSLGASKVDEKYLDLSGEVLRGQAMSTFIQESKGSA